jgi:predicted HAD superfamily Cof-like phosphohydrolase
VTEVSPEEASTESECKTVSIERTSLHDMLMELKRLRMQVFELQTEATKQVEQRRANDLTQQVSNFHRQFGYPIRYVPGLCSEEEARFRYRLIAEEFLELTAAMFATRTHLTNLSLTTDLLLALDAVCQTGRVDVELDELAKEAADLDYVVEGTRLYFGIPRQMVANEVQRTNMNKVGGPVDEHGKQLKPEGWKPANIRDVLMKAGAKLWNRST